MDSKNEEHIKKVYLDKTNRLLKISISVVLAYITKNFIEQKKIELAKKIIVYAVSTAALTTVLIILFCIINPSILNLRSIMLAKGNYELESAYIDSGLALWDSEPDAYSWAALIGCALNCIAITSLQYLALKSVFKADGTMKSTDFVENFYDEL